MKSVKICWTTSGKAQRDAFWPPLYQLWWVQRRINRLRFGAPQAHNTLQPTVWASQHDGDKNICKIRLSKIIQLVVGKWWLNSRSSNWLLSPNSHPSDSFVLLNLATLPSPSLMGLFRLTMAPPGLARAKIDTHINTKRLNCLQVVDTSYRLLWFDLNKWGKCSSRAAWSHRNSEARMAKAATQNPTSQAFQWIRGFICEALDFRSWSRQPHQQTPSSMNSTRVPWRLFL